MILSGDIGGTKTNLAFFEEKEGKYSFSHLFTFSSKDMDLPSMIRECFSKTGLKNIQCASFAIAGPVKNGVCKATNLPWIVDAAQLSKTLNIPYVFLLNDLEANAYALEILDDKDLYNLQKPLKTYFGNKVVVSPGTGLGEAGLFWDGSKHHPFASEGGHCDFGPRGELQIDLCRYIFRKFGHASYERVLSGPGLHNIFLFFMEELKWEVPDWILEEMHSEDPAKVITEHALNGKSELCKKCLELFVSIFGAEASNSALKYMSLGGVYLGGGIPPKILPFLQEPYFLHAFLDKGRFRDFLEDIPIWVILDDKASLKGSAHYGFMHLRACSKSPN